MQQQQQHLMQMQQPMMAAYASPNQVTTDIIQQYLDENKQLILAILDNQSSGKAEECAENQAKLQRNLMYLAAIADNQPQVPAMAQVSANAALSARYMQHQQAQLMTPQSLMAARSSNPYSQSPISSLQQQQAAMLGQLSRGGGSSSSSFMLHGEANVGGNGSFPDYARMSTGKQMGNEGNDEEGN